MGRESSQEHTKRFLIVTLFFTLGTALGKLLGFAKEITLGAYFGTNHAVDAYVVALNIPTIVFTGITGAFAFSFIPIFMELKGKDSLKAYRFMNNFLNIVLLIFFIPLLLIELQPHLFISIFANGLPEQTALLSAYLLQIIFPTVFCTFMIDIFNAYLNSLHKFRITSMQWVILNGITLIIFVSLVNWIGIYALALGVIIGNIVQNTLVYFASKREGYRYRFVIDWKDPSLKTMIKLSIPAFITSMSIQINLLVDRTLVSGLEEGSIAALNYSQKLYFIPLGLIAAPVLTVMYPKFVGYVTDSKWKDFVNLMETNIKVLLYLFIPVFIYFTFFTEQIVKVVYNYGEFGKDSIMMTATALQFYALAALMQPLKDLLDRLLFSLKLNRYIMYASIFSMIINVILCIILVNKMGLAGAALSTSIASASTVIILLWMFQKFMKEKEAVNLYYGGFLFKCIVASFISLFTSKLMLHFTHDTKLLILLAIAIGAIVYLLVTYMLKIKELQQLLSLFLGKRNDINE
ncbi:MULTISPECIES: murein biosynthesis integral membrane protein MurJ [Bacillus]|uniref:Lipid II flippase n=1 Tax=Bacillus wiedmannii TaxID=1890302 RepID=A0A2C4PV92_9BACI|nr:murein biosynthesis integral membrane protein MurJ [Bacillus wiedmannii]OUB47217.1 murein biosynthesis integral membrane protein MurJ [Bacillus thuringiensis serovar argentinensis]KPU54275.1 murein biosynthesis integral membrane protein MurJ [Bacillus wiedmannii]MCU5095509.1 murein biosynthesis integral membrane protein MurJ [Bacillus wiedmannii]PHD62604.1 murein biosynthesis integral membrane protein MurJ [Bacillus wiedmannii]PRT03657.1 murein biosynthesis integral membrane protein MurJ [B